MLERVCSQGNNANNDKIIPICTGQLLTIMPILNIFNSSQSRR